MLSFLADITPTTVEVSYWDKLTHLQFNQAIVDAYVASFVTGAVRFLLGMIVLFAGLFLLKRALRWFNTKIDNRHIDGTIKTFIKNLVNVAAKILLIFIVLNVIGIKTTSLVAVFGAAGLAVGLALQGSLANFAGGVLLLFFKPFRVGDKIEVQGKKGKVAEIQIFNTILMDDEKKIIIPNSMVSNGVVVNLTSQNNVVTTINFVISAATDLDKLRTSLQAYIQQNERTKLVNDVSLEVTDFDKESLFIEMEYKLPNQSGNINSNQVRELLHHFLVEQGVELTTYNQLYGKLFQKAGA